MKRNSKTIFYLYLIAGIFVVCINCIYITDDCICMDGASSGYLLKQGGGGFSSGNLSGQIIESLSAQMGGSQMAASGQQQMAEVCTCVPVAIAQGRGSMGSAGMGGGQAQQYVAVSTPPAQQYVTVATPPPVQTEQQYVAVATPPPAPAQQYVAMATPQPAQAQQYVAMASPPAQQYMAMATPQPAQAQQYVAMASPPAQQIIPSAQMVQQAQYVQTAAVPAAQVVKATPVVQMQVGGGAGSMGGVPVGAVNLTALQAAQLAKVKKSGQILQAAEAASLTSACQADKMAKAAVAVTEIGATEAKHAKQMAAVAAMANLVHQENTKAAIKSYEIMQKLNRPAQLVAVAPSQGYAGGSGGGMGGSISVVPTAAVAVSQPQPQRISFVNVGAGAGSMGGSGISEGMGMGMGMAQRAESPVLYGVVSSGVSGRQCICPPIYEAQVQSAMNSSESGEMGGFGAKLAAGLASKIMTGVLNDSVGYGGIESSALCIEKIKAAQAAANIQQMVASGGLTTCLDVVGKSGFVDSAMLSNLVCYC